MAMAGGTQVDIGNPTSNATWTGSGTSFSLMDPFLILVPIIHT